MSERKRKGPRTVYGENPHYKFRTRDSIFSDMRYLWKISGLSLQKIAENTGLSYSTLRNWFITEKTVSPRHDNVQIFFRSFGIRYGDRDREESRGRRRLRLVA